MYIKNVPEIIQYTPGILDNVQVHTFTSSKRAAAFLWKNKNHFIWNIMSCFENMPVSLPDTETILNGYTVGNVSIRDMLKIRSYGRALESLCYDIRDEIFYPDRYTLIELHKIAAKSEIEDIELGHFRREDVQFRNVTWKPPHHSDLKYYWKYIDKYINNNRNKLENALVIFLALSRTQFFPDVNKRTAMLFSNGYLMTNNIAPILIPNEEKSNFSNLLVKFYENGQADSILKFLGETSVIEPDTSNTNSNKNDISIKNKYYLQIEEYCNKILNIFKNNQGCFYLCRNNLTNSFYTDFIQDKILPNDYEKLHKNISVIHSTYNIFNYIPKEAKESEIIQIVKNEIDNIILKEEIKERQKILKN